MLFTYLKMPLRTLTQQYPIILNNMSAISAFPVSINHALAVSLTSSEFKELQWKKSKFISDSIINMPVFMYIRMKILVDCSLYIAVKYWCLENLDNLTMIVSISSFTKNIDPDITIIKNLDLYSM
jgi:hypothetical protein